MSRELRNRISYWFFLIAGMAGVTIQMYFYFLHDLKLSFNNGVVTSVFSVFILRPNILIEAFKAIITKINPNAK